MKEFWKDWDFWNPELTPLPTEVSTYKKISICTNCMGRSEDLKKTLIKNLEDNIDYPSLEFVVLNYNSQDDMDDFMNCKDILKFKKYGVLRYIKTQTPKFYSMSHSRNICFKNSSGDIVTNVDADNFCGKNFAYFLNKLSLIRPEKAFFAKGKRMMHGRIGMYKNEFLNIGGYNEDLSGYGFDDHDLMIRSMSLGFKLMWWAGVSDEDFTKRIKTPRSVVGENMENKNWKQTEKLNKEISLNNIKNGIFIANQNKNWGYVKDLQEL